MLELLRDEIIDMRLQPGQRLVERELIERIGVSRTTIREVMRQLVAEGLVTTIPQKGAIVAMPSREQALEVYEVRALLEGLVARECAENASAAQLQELRDAFSEFEASHESGDARLMLQAKSRFYDGMFDGAGNETVRSILESLQARVSVLRATTMTRPGRAPESVREIRAIVGAIEARDADAAASACSFHVRQAARTLISSQEPSRSSEPATDHDQGGTASDE
ncbi:MAG TPA: GntR family transcriptional regulator [Solirubrobacteraceae bacterium]